MKILGIETSCDETAASVVNNGTKILSNIIASSSEMHAKTGGIIPEQAARQQVKSIIPVIQEALGKVTKLTRYKAYGEKNSVTRLFNNIVSPEIDAIAVTVGPGLIGSLLVGVETAKTLSWVWKKPIIPVNHLVAHIYANWLEPEVKGKKSKNKKIRKPEFPALALVVSGGHTDLVLMRGHGKIQWIGGTRDDAAGEALDKTARLLGLPYPGGPSISKKAEKYLSENSEFKIKNLKLFPRPLLNEKNFDLSFSGLKTAVLREVRGKRLKEKDIERLSAEIQEAIVDSLVEKSIRAIKIFKPKSFLLAGGVAANKRLRKKILSKILEGGLKAKLHVPEPILCTDNAAYVASYAYFNYHPIPWKKISVDPELTITDLKNL